MARIAAAEVTGLVLAGGRGSRMGGVDKGLQLFRGRPLAAHALARLGPQVDALAVSANRHLDAYAAFGQPVLVDGDDAYAGPLAGLLAGLAHRRNASPGGYLATVPCDAPFLPLDLVSTLSAALTAGDTAVACAAVRDADGVLRRQPVFCLLHARVAPSLARFVAEGGRKVGAWLDAEGALAVAFDDAAAFANVNSEDDLRRLEARR